jgi:hypothetical protein
MLIDTLLVTLVSSRWRSFDVSSQPPANEKLKAARLDYDGMGSSLDAFFSLLSMPSRGASFRLISFLSTRALSKALLGTVSSILGRSG